MIDGELIFEDWINTQSYSGQFLALQAGDLFCTSLFCEWRKGDEESGEAVA
jgi:hypothetical protein